MKGAAVRSGYHCWCLALSRGGRGAGITVGPRGVARSAAMTSLGTRAGAARSAGRHADGRARRHEPAAADTSAAEVDWPRCILAPAWRTWLGQGSRGVGFRIAVQGVEVEIAVYYGAIHVTVAYLYEARTALTGNTGFYWVDAGDRDYQWFRIRSYARYGVSCSPARLSLGWILLLVAAPIRYSLVPGPSAAEGPLPQVRLRSDRQRQRAMPGVR